MPQQQMRKICLLQLLLFFWSGCWCYSFGICYIWEEFLVFMGSFVLSKGYSYIFPRGCYYNNLDVYTNKLSKFTGNQNCQQNVFLAFFGGQHLEYLLYHEVVESLVLYSPNFLYLLFNSVHPLEMPCT